MSLVARIIADDAIAMEQLRAVRSLDLPDWCIAAGFVRNRVWDHLHGIVPARLPADALRRLQLAAQLLVAAGRADDHPRAGAQTMVQRVVGAVEAASQPQQRGGGGERQQG